MGKILLGHKRGLDRSGAEAPAAGVDYRELFQAVPTPVLLVDHATLRVVAANPAATRALGYSEEELLASDLPDLAAAADRHALRRLPEPAPVPGLLEARSSWRILRRDDSPLRFEVGLARVHHAGQPCALLFQPPTSEPGAQAVGVTGAAQPEFSFSALHDLKEPLHLIKGYLALLRSHAGATLDPEGREYLEAALGGTQRMQTIVLNLLEFFRVDARGMAPEPLDLQQMVDDAVAGLRLQVQESGATVAYAGLPHVMADRLHVARLLQNLLSNAIKFRGDRPPRIEVGARRDGARWDVWVKDDGIGIDPKDHDKVLQPFQRLHSSDRYPGTGLGLSICKKIAEMHGGRLWLDSALGSGTTVHVTLPAVEAT